MPALLSPSLTQIAMCVVDLPRSVRFYCEALGFVNAGGRVFWGPGLARIQGLGDDAQCTVWWAVGRQDFLQLEFFHHTMPRQKPRHPGWRPSDLGYVRWGLAVSDFDATLQRAAGFDVHPITPPVTVDGLRRVCLPDPDGLIIELFEDGDTLPGGRQTAYREAGACVVYAAISVANLEAVCALYVDTLGMPDAAGVTLHTSESEALWGLPGARRRARLLRAGDALFEVVQYEDPAPRARQPGQLPSDQGFLNVAVGFRERERFDEMLGRAMAAGYVPNAPVAPGPGFGATYLQDGMGGTIEMFGCPREYDTLLGFEPEVDHRGRRASGAIR